MNILKSRLKFIKGTRFVSFLFIGCSILIAAGILLAANMYYNIDTGEIVMEEIQRTTGLIRAVGGLIVGGTSTQDPATGYGFEVATSTLFSSGDVVLSAADQLLKFMGGHASNYIGFRAPTGLTSTSTYTWPGATPATTTQLLVSDQTGAMSWISLGEAGVGGVTAVGDCTGGACFTQDGTQGTSLWFYDAQGRGELKITDLTAIRTYTLPNLTGTIALQNAGSLGTGGVLFANSGLISTSTNFSWDDGSRRLSLGATSTANGIIRLYGGTSGYVEFLATSTGSGITYTWPQTAGSDLFLTTDSSGNLRWLDIPGGGGVIGNGAADQVAFWTGASTISGTSSFAWNGSRLTLGDTAGLVTKLIEYTGGDLELRTNSSGDIFLNPASNIVQLATSTYIRTQEGYEIGKEGTEILKEMIPILGFDLPVQTATTSYIKISKTLENYPFQGAATGTARIHKLVFRYAASTTADIDWRVSTSTGQTYSSSTLPQPTSENLEMGNAYVATTTIPTDSTDWWVEIKTPDVPSVVRIFQVFLAAYDQIQ